MWPPESATIPTFCCQLTPLCGWDYLLIPPVLFETMYPKYTHTGRPVRNMKKFEEGVFSDLRNLKPGTDACLEEPKVRTLLVKLSFFSSIFLLCRFSVWGVYPSQNFGESWPCNYIFIHKLGVSREEDLVKVEWLCLPAIILPTAKERGNIGIHIYWYEWSWNFFGKKSTKALA